MIDREADGSDSLEGFVMNRVTGDYFETLLYKVFVSLDEHTTISEMASLLEVDLALVKDAVSLYCRLGFAKKKNITTIIGAVLPKIKISQLQHSHLYVFLCRTCPTQLL